MISLPLRGSSKSATSQPDQSGYNAKLPTSSLSICQQSSISPVDFCSVILSRSGDVSKRFFSPQAQELAGLRMWQVGGFEKFLIFYLLRSSGVSVVRVLRPPSVLRLHR